MRGGHRAGDDAAPHPLLLRRLLPDCVAVCESPGTRESDAAATAELFAQEAALVAAAQPERRREFAGARHCARRALAHFGVAPVPIGRGPGRAPIWPPGYVGSLTHCAGYRAAAVARTAAVRTLGIDAEVAETLGEPGILDLVADPIERRWLRELTIQLPGPPWDRLLFSAKEAVYKAWYPLTGRWLGFDNARVTLDPGGCFVAELHDVAAPFTRLDGRWAMTGGILATGVVVERR